eukprot:3941175-Prymnesium_polylepis.2
MSSWSAVGPKTNERLPKGRGLKRGVRGRRTAREQPKKRGSGDGCGDGNNAAGQGCALGFDEARLPTCRRRSSRRRWPRWSAPGPAARRVQPQNLTRSFQMCQDPPRCTPRPCSRQRRVTGSGDDLIPRSASVPPPLGWAPPQIRTT